MRPFSRFRLALVLIVIAAAGWAPAQNPSPTALQNSAQQVAPAAQLKLPVPLVVEDLTVLDRNDQPVQGLKASDLTVTENGKPVALRVFEEHVPPPHPAAIPKMPDMGPNIYTNVQPAPNDNSLYILLLDALNTPMTDQAYVRYQMLKYLKNLPPGMRVAVFGLSTRLYLLQGFTSDAEVLKAAIDSKRNKHASPLLDDPVSGAPVEQLSDTVQEQMDMNDPVEQMMLANLQQFEAETATQQTRMRVIYTLQAMNELARYLSAFPGRKNLIWFSGSFPLNIFPDLDLQDPFGAMADFQDDMRKTTELMARSRVAVYPVDGRGLFVNPAFTASQSGASLARSSRTNPAAFANAESKFLQQTAAEHAAMDMIAEQTGGQAFYNTNGLKQAVEKVTELGDHFYTIAYTPPNAKQDGGYRRIAIKVNRPGLRLEYRKGYLADDPNEEKHGEKVLPENAMTVAMMRGGPDAAQILFDAAVIPADAPVTVTTKGSRPDPKLMKPPYRSYAVQYLVDIGAVAFTLTDKDREHCELEFVAVVYDADGEAVNSAASAIKLDLTPQSFAALSKNGLLARQTIEAPMKGDYFLRVGVHDLASDRVGSIEIPLSVLKSRQQMIDAEKKLQGSAGK